MDKLFERFSIFEFIRRLLVRNKQILSRSHSSNKGRVLTNVFLLLGFLAKLSVKIEIWNFSFG
ncbi:hypothetical protein DLM78_16915 [Leptospira stimsonii]|uniref:Uncharacterized protein n=1 Tax=Leptospira stimsonii TaxID=2202203 RepID=A0A8B3CLP4_9LEPT|nr:hypothetical protein DLM78_16915 [Leptospira stimsonii]